MIDFKYHFLFSDFNVFIYLFKIFLYILGFTTCKAEQPLQGMELQEKEVQKD